MTRRTLRIESERLPLARPFRISRGTKTAAEVVTVTLSQDGVEGRGECVPYPRYGESIAKVRALIDAMRSALEDGAGRAEIRAAMPAGAARNAVDCALWDLELRIAGQSLASALGLARTPLATAMTIGLDDPEAMGRAAGLLASVPLLKVKVDAHDPGAALRSVRAAAPRPRLIVDPNESWTMAEVDGLQGLMRELRVDCLEQPLPAGEDSALCDYRSTIPIAADEAIHTLADLDTLPAGYAIVNVKLDKTGGLTEALALVDGARARGLCVMTGCMICSSLSIAPALGIAAQSVLVDCDGPLWLSVDRAGGVTAVDGVLSWPEPGFWGGPI